MQWKPEHDVIFSREVLASDMHSTRKGSTVAEQTDESEKKKAKAEKETAETMSHGNIKWESENKQGEQRGD